MPNLPALDLQNMAAVRNVTRDYFQTLGIPLLRGRPFDRSDGVKSGKAAIVNQSMGRRFWPGKNPIGQRFRAILDVYEVVGEVADVRHDGLQHASRFEFYLPFDQSPGPSMDLVVRTSGDAALTAAEIRRQVSSVDPNQPISKIRRMEDVVESSVAPQRSLTLLLAAFSLLALLLAAVGCYGVMAYSVSQRVREMGLRMALGASSVSILQLVLKRGVILTFAGLFVGMLSALALTRFLTNLLFEIRPLDPVAFFSAGAIIFVVILLGCYVPARRASRVDPMAALRCE
jgi:putative ABC transport system permease protein